MKRGLFAAAILGLAAVSATAGDVYTPYPGCGANGTYNPYAAYQPQTRGHGGIRHGATRGGCNACGTQQCDRRDRWQKFMDFLCYKPTIPCETWCQPTPYTPPLRAWFPPHRDGMCDTGCANTGAFGRRLAPCGNGGHCASCAHAAHSGAPLAPAAQPAVPTVPAPKSSAYMTLARPAPVAGPTIVPQSYTVTKPAYSTTLQGPGLPPPPSPYLPGGFAMPRN